MKRLERSEEKNVEPRSTDPHTLIKHYVIVYLMSHIGCLVWIIQLCDEVTHRGAEGNDWAHPSEKHAVFLGLYLENTPIMNLVAINTNN